MDGQKLLEKIAKSKDLPALAKKVNSKEWFPYVCDAVKITFNCCNEMSKLQHEKYLEKIKPLQIIVNDINNQLQKEDYSLEERERLYLKLFDAQQRIQLASSTEVAWKQVAIALGAGVLAGALLTGIIKALANRKSTGGSV